MPETNDIFLPSTKTPLVEYHIPNVSAATKSLVPSNHSGITPPLWVSTRRKPSPEDHDDPCTRVSIYRKVFSSSIESDWIWMAPVGWIHITEKPLFCRDYAKCDATGVWIASDLVKIQVCDDGLRRVCEEYANKIGLVRTYSGHLAKPDECEKVKTMDGGENTTLVHRSQLDELTSICDFDHTVWLSPCLIKVHGSPSYKRVCRVYIDGENFMSCAKCERIFDADNMEHDDDEGDSFCAECYEQVSIKKIIFPHNYDKYPEIKATPLPRFSTIVEDGILKSSKFRDFKESPIRLFGVEVETEMDIKMMMKKNLRRHHVAQSILDVIGVDFVIAKEDGSLITNGKYSDGDQGAKYAGFEIVTAPASLDIHYERWPLLANSEYFSLLRAWDTKTCGFHVHVSRKGMSALQIARIVLFVNHPANKMFIQKVAGRGSDKYCRYFNKEPKDAIGVHHKNDDNRRQAVNLTNPKTIEFRMFRGTVNPKHIMRNMEFCDAICDFCYPASRSLKEIESTEPFLQFVKSKSKRWPLLAAWLGLHKFIGIRQPKDPKFSDMMSVNISDVPENEIPVLVDGF